MQDEHGFCICADDVNVGGTVIGRINHDPQAAYAQDSRHCSTLSETQALGNAGVVLGVRLGRRLAAVRIASAPAKRIPFRDISAAFKQPFPHISEFCTNASSALSLGAVISRYRARQRSTFQHFLRTIGWICWNGGPAMVEFQQLSRILFLSVGTARGFPRTQS